MPRLKRSDCSGPGITRRKHGKGFVYLDEDGDRISDKETVQRISELVIPPAWKDVWICPYPMGHIQATGIDAAGRKQYLYHQRWRERRDQAKFDEMVKFAHALPTLRRRLARDLKGKEMTRERVLACAVRLLDRGFFRIGGEDYAEANESYGLATMKKEHVTIDGAALTFDFPAKSGKQMLRYIVDEEIAQIVKTLKQRRGGIDELFAYKDRGRWRDVKSADINAYIKDITGGDFTAKDFRTWNGTVLAAVGFSVTGEASRSKAARKRVEAHVVKEVARFLGNTPAVARASYIDPRVIDHFRDGYVIEPVLVEIGMDPDIGQPAIQGKVEDAVLDLIEEPRKSRLVEKVA